MNDPYEGLTLDQIFELADADYHNVEHLNGQAESSRMFTNQVQDSIKQFRKALSEIGASMTYQPPPTNGDLALAVATVFSGLTAEATVMHTQALTESTTVGGDGMEPQGKVIEDISAEVRNTYYKLDDLRFERDALLHLATEDPEHPDLTARYPKANGDYEALVKAIHHDFDEQGRTRMRSAADGYYALAASLPKIKPYQGPRIPAPESDGYGPPQWDPSWNRPGRPFTPTSTTPLDSTPTGSGAPLPPPPGHVAPELQSGGALVPPPAGLPTPTGPLPPGGSVFVPSGPVVPPVIGGRPGVIPPVRPPAAPPVPVNRGTSPAQRFGGGNRPVTRPVIGQRGAVPPTRGLPPGGRGLPGSGARGVPGGMRGGSGQPPRGTTGGRGLPGLGRGSGGRTVPTRGGLPGNGTGGRRSAQRSGRVRDTGGANRSPRGFGANRAGVRTSSAAESTPERQGRVIGRRGARTESTPAGPRRGVRGVRVPRVVHGGNETVNRPVIGSRSEAARLAAARAFGRAEEEPDTVITSQVEEENEWVDLRGTVRPVITAGGDREVEHDPGNFLTRYNLGRGR